MPDNPNVEHVHIDAQGASVPVPSWLSAADQQALANDLKQPKGSPEFKDAAKKWKKQVNELKKEAKQLDDASANAKDLVAKGEAADMAAAASSHAKDLEATVLKGFGGQIKLWKIVLPITGAVIIIAVVVVLAGGGGGGGGKHKAQQEKGAPKAPIAWTEKIVGTDVDASCQAVTTIEFTVVDGDKYAGQTAVVEMSGTQHATKNVTVGAGGAFQAQFDHTLEPNGPGSCKDTETYAIVSVGGDTNMAVGQTVG